MYDNLPTSLPLVLEGRLRALAVSGETRVPALPDVPTFAEAGLADMNWMAFFGLVAPEGHTGADRLQRLSDTLGKALALPRCSRQARRPAGRRYRHVSHRIQG